MENIINIQEQKKSVSEGGLEAGIESMREKIVSFTSMIN
jgi:predicted HTH domain antitoxin